MPRRGISLICPMSGFPRCKDRSWIRRWRPWRCTPVHWHRTSHHNLRRDLWVHRRLVRLRVSPSWWYMADIGTHARTIRKSERNSANEPNHMSSSIANLAEDRNGMREGGEWTMRGRRKRVYQWSAVRVEVVECRLSWASNLALRRRDLLSGGVSGYGPVICLHCMRFPSCSSCWKRWSKRLVRVGTSGQGRTPRNTAWSSCYGPALGMINQTSPTAHQAELTLVVLGVHQRVASTRLVAGT